MGMEWINIIGVVGGLVALLCGVATLGRCHGWHPEWQRKILHVALGSTALTFPWLFGPAWQVWAVCGLGATVMIAVRMVPQLRRRVGTSLHEVGRTTCGELLFALTIGALYTITQNTGEQDHILHYVLPLAVLTWADSAAALVGTRWGRHRFTVLDGQKSWEGVVAFALVSGVVTALGLTLLTSLPWPVLLLVTALVVFISTCTEAVAWRGLDNLLVPTAVYLMLNSVPINDLTLLTGQVAGALLITVTVLIMPRQLPLHTRFTATLAIFCCWSGSVLVWLPAVLALLLIQAVFEKAVAARPNQLLALPLDAMPVYYWLALRGA